MKVIQVLFIVGLFSLVFWAWTRTPILLEDVHPLLESFQRLANEKPFLFIPAFSLLYFFGSIFGVPGSLTTLHVAAGFALGFWPGCAWIDILLLSSALLTYGLGAKFQHLDFFKTHQIFLRKKLWRREKYEFLFLLGLRLSPLVPFNVLNFAAGALAVPLGIYVASTFLGTVFDVVVLVGLGHRLNALHQGQEGLSQFVWVLSLALLLFILLSRHYFWRRIEP